MLKTSLFLATLLSSTAAFAQDVPRAEETAPAPDAAAATSSGNDDASIVVTATRTPTTIDRVAASVTVLDKTAIDRTQDIGVTELLLRTPGISISRNGGYGTATSLRIRGAESDQTVVVIDGVKLNDPSATGGGYNFANLLTGDAARVEVEILAQAPGFDAVPDSATARLAAELGAVPSEEKVNYGTEAGQYAAVGIDTVVCGPGDIAQAHTADEYVDLSQLLACEEFVQRLVDHLSVDEDGSDAA